MFRFFRILNASLVNGILLAKVCLWVFPRQMLRLLRPTNPKPGEPPPSRRRWLLMLSFIEWDGSWQRPQHLALHLSRALEVSYCAPVRAHNLGFWRAWRLLFRPWQKEREDLAVGRPVLFPCENRFRLIRRLNALLLYDLLTLEIRAKGRIPDLLLANSPYFAEVFSWLPARVRAYDVMDELTRFAWAPPDAKELEELLVAQCSLVTTGTLSLSRLKNAQYGALGCNARYVALGVDSAHFAPRAGMGVPADMANLPRPIVGFFGALNERVDPVVLDALAVEFVEGSIVLIGPQYQRFHLLHDRVNIHCLGLKPYAALPAYLAAFDCAIIPYRLSDGVEFVQPVKVLEYLAGGKPVVSTAIPDVEELYGGLVRIGRDPQDFARKAREAVGEGGSRAAEYRAAAQARGWGEMAAEFLRLFEETIGAQEQGARNVAHLLHGVHFGGAEQMAISLCQGYDPVRYAGSIICLGRGATVQERLRAGGIPSQVVEMRGRLDLGVLFRLLRHLRMHRISILHTHSSRTNLLGRLLGRMAGVPVVTTVHTAIARDINDLGKSNRINAWVERRMQRDSDRLVSVSERNLADILRQGAHRERALHIPNGVPIPSEQEIVQSPADMRRELGLPEDGPVVGMIAMMRPRKGPEVLLRAMPGVLERMPGARLLMVGSAEFVEKADYLKTLRDLAASLGIAEQTIFTGYRADAAQLIRTLDVLVLPSLFGEGMPLALLEAMAWGKPVVASRTEGNEEVVRDGETGLLVAPNDSKALWQAIVQIITNPDLARMMGRSGRKLAVERFSVERMAEQYEAVYSAISPIHP